MTISDKDYRDHAAWRRLMFPTHEEKQQAKEVPEESTPNAKMALACADLLEFHRPHSTAEVEATFKVGYLVKVKNSGRLGIVTSVSLSHIVIDEQVWNQTKQKYVFLRESMHHIGYLEAIDSFPMNRQQAMSSWLRDCVLQHNKVRDDV
jgi:hypothetical protein